MTCETKVWLCLSLHVIIIIIIIIVVIVLVFVVVVAVAIAADDAAASVIAADNPNFTAVFLLLLSLLLLLLLLLSLLLLLLLLLSTFLTSQQFRWFSKRYRSHRPRTSYSLFSQKLSNCTVMCSIGALRIRMYIAGWRSGSYSLLCN